MRRRRVLARIVAGAGAWILAGACTFLGTTAPSGSGPSSAATSDDNPLPIGYGTLRQDEVTLTLGRGDLLIQVTPLAPDVIRLTAPDTFARLRELREGHGPTLTRRTGLPAPALFLVSFFSYEQEVPFQPEDLHLLNRGLRFRPVGIEPVTPGWGVQRLSQEETQMAIYAFTPDLDLEQDLAVEYQEMRRGGWERILQRLEAERTRVLGRARTEG